MAALSISADFQPIYVLKFGMKADITMMKIELVADIDPINRFEMVMVSRSADLSNTPR